MQEFERVKILQVGQRVYDMSRLADVKGTLSQFLQSPKARWGRQVAQPPESRVRGALQLRASVACVAA